MKKTLLLMLVLIWTLLNACKKDNLKTVRPKLKSITQINVRSVVFRTEFDYNAAGQLSKSRQYRNKDLIIYTDYNQTTSNLITASIYQKNAGGGDVELAEAKFRYETDRLSQLIIQYKNVSPGTTSKTEITFDYSAENIPKVTSTSSEFPLEIPNINPPNPRVGTIHFEDLSGSSSSQSSTSDLTSGCTFDDKVNPLQNLPVIISIKMEQIQPWPVSNQYFHLFNAINFFQPNNLIRTDDGSGTFSIGEYSYNEKGWPTKSTWISSIGQTKTETTYEYW